MPEETIDIAVVGLGFGEEFLPIYRAHPSVGRIAIVDPSAARLAEVGDQHDIPDRFADLGEVLATDRWDAVHVLAPVGFHADYSVAVLESGRHCACAVPMATELDDLRRVIAAQRRSGRVYMMMETSVYGREFLYAQDLHRAGRLGALTAYRGYHIQNLDGYPRYWTGYPPMKYVTHALSPALALTGSGVGRVTAFGSGRLTPEREGDYGNPFPVEVGLFALRSHDLVPQVTMSFFQTARPYVEGFDLYGDRVGLEWPADNEGPLTVHELEALDPTMGGTGLRGRRSTTTVVAPPSFAERLPAALASFTAPFTLPARAGFPARTRPASHGGSHPHLVHEFVSSVVSGRAPAIGAVTAADWTAPGICAHESALRGGESVVVPEFGD